MGDIKRGRSYEAVNVRATWLRNLGIYTAKQEINPPRLTQVPGSVFEIKDQKYTEATAFSEFCKPTIELTPVLRSGPFRKPTRRTAQSTSRRGRPILNVELAVYITRDQSLYSRQCRSRNTSPSSTIHEVYYAIRTTATGQTGAILVVAAASGTVKDSSRYEQKRNATVYISPRPGHGPHRYLFTLVALTESINGSKMSPCVRPGDDARENGVGFPFGIW